MKSLLNIAISLVLVGLYFAIGASVAIICQISILLILLVNGPNFFGERFERLLTAEGMPSFLDRRPVQIVTTLGALLVALTVFMVS